MGWRFPGIHMFFISGCWMSEIDPKKQDADGADAENGSATTPQLMQRVYNELRALASDYLSRERAGHTLQPTALVHEAYLRLAELDRMQWRDKTHFLVAASGCIRRVLVDHARGKDTAKRGGGWHRITLSAGEGMTPRDEVDFVALEDALTKLASLDARKARVVELRFFGGLTIAQSADVLHIGTSTVEDDWAFACAWLRRELA